MSWIFGFTGTINNSIVENISKIIKKPIKVFTEENFYAVGGGNLKTLFFSKNSVEDRSGFIFSGVGISNSGSRNLFGREEWQQKIIDDDFSFDGHFTGLRWGKNSLELFTDQLGLRDIYFAKKENNIYFSTRIDWLAKIVPTEIDFKEFGSRWLLFNQISKNSVLKNIERLSSGKTLKYYFETKQIKISQAKWEPDFYEKNNSKEEITETLETIISAPFNSDKIISLSLSGGMDSRVILSLLLNSDNNDWDTHTFGDTNLPDAEIAEGICKKLKVRHHQIDSQFTSENAAFHLLEEYVCETIVNNSASSIIQLNNYNFLEKDKIIIDGGFGEIWRREFLAGLFYRGEKFIREKDIVNILPFLKIPRADIFNQDVRTKMEEGCREQLVSLIDEMPLPEEIGIENWLDFFAIKTRLPNYYSHEQTRLDSIITSYMPFIQKSVLKNLFALPVEKRKNGKFFRSIINRNSELKKFPLVKGNTRVPYRLTTLQSRIWNLLHKKLFPDNNKDLTTVNFLNLLFEPINDFVNSKDFQETGFYEHIKIKKMIEEFFKGNHQYAEEIDWWLSFEIFRRNI